MPASLLRKTLIHSLRRMQSHSHGGFSFARNVYVFGSRTVTSGGQESTAEEGRGQEGRGEEEGRYDVQAMRQGMRDRHLHGSTTVSTPPQRLYKDKARSTVREHEARHAGRDRDIGVATLTGEDTGTGVTAEGQGVRSVSRGRGSRRQKRPAKSLESLQEKFDFLQTETRKHVDNLIVTPSGVIRLDAMNKPTEETARERSPPSQDSIHHQDPDFELRVPNSGHVEGSTFIDDQYFALTSNPASEETDLSGDYESQSVKSESAASVSNVKWTPAPRFAAPETLGFDTLDFPEPVSEDKTHIEDKISQNSEQSTTQTNTFDEYYFPEEKVKSETTTDMNSTESTSSEADMNDFDKYYFPDQAQNTTMGMNSKLMEESKSENIFEEQYFDTKNKNVADSFVDLGEKHSISVTEQTNQLNTLQKADNISRGLGNDSVLDIREDIIVNTVTKAEERRRMRNKTQYEEVDTENPKTAFDMMLKLRQERKQKEREKSGSPKVESAVVTPQGRKWDGTTDSRGFRILTSQVTDLQRLPQHEVISLLKDSVLFQNDELLAIDKPYGLPSHGGPGVHHSVGKLLHVLGEALGPGSLGPGKSLRLLHRLDKETTGVMLLAKTEEAMLRLHTMFKKREIVKRYWVLTKGVPVPREGVIEIPMAEETVAGKYRMGLRPNYNSDTKILMGRAKKVKKQEAVTNYKVLESANDVALIECQPETGLKHQIRCHLSFGLNTPILGDHKYSHFSKLAPQKLYPTILQRLGIRQAKVRHLAMHLHAKCLILPEYQDGRNLFINARLPRHFLQNMKWLKIKPPKDLY